MRLRWFVLGWALSCAFPALIQAQDDETTPKRDAQETDAKRTQAQKEEDQKRKEKEDADRKKRDEDARKALKEGEKACAVVGGTCVIFGIVALAGLALQIFLLVWTYKDAKARGDQNAIVWLILVFLFGLIGLIVYLIARPKGDMGICRNCQGKMMMTLTKCPHCGAGAGA